MQEVASIHWRYPETIPRGNTMTRTTEDLNHTIERDVFHSEEGFVSGTPIFVGTRVPLKNLFDYLAGGHNLDEF